MHQVQVSLLLTDKALTKVLPKYLDYADVFFFNLAIELPKNTGINEHAIALVEGKQSPYRPVYSLKPVELETLKTYIETHQTTGFIQPFKSIANVPIFFNRKPEESLRFCVNYRGLNNLTIKNQYFLFLIEEALD